MYRNHLAGSQGDAVNALMAAVGYNFRLLLVWLPALLGVLLATVVNARNEPGNEVYAG
jgi:IS5 family transposase